jgi:hypothetical protein
MKSPQTKPSLSFNRRLGAYSTLAAAGACAATTTVSTSVNANVVYSGPLNQAIPATATGGFINMTTFQFGTSYGAVNGGNTSTPALNLWGTSASRAWMYPTGSTVNRFVSDASNNPLELVAGTLISAASLFGSSATPTALTPGGAWVGGTIGYLGIRFLSGAQTLYGWAQVSVPNGAPTTANPIRLLGVAYEDSGAGIIAGNTGAALPSVPDSGSTLGLLAAGCAATASLAWRRRKVA